MMKFACILLFFLSSTVAQNKKTICSFLSVIEAETTDIQNHFEKHHCAQSASCKEEVGLAVSTLQDTLRQTFERTHCATQEHSHHTCRNLRSLVNLSVEVSTEFQTIVNKLMKKALQNLRLMSRVMCG